MNEIERLAPVILAEIKKAKSILLHCHPSPDPDSVGSALAMKLALEQMGKQATVIQGDSKLPQAFMHFPGAGAIVAQNFFETDLSKFDLFISQDSAALQMVSRKGSFPSPFPMPLINIDHHRSNERFGSINLVVDTYPATSQLLHDLFIEWGVKIAPDMAANLFIGIYTDTGGFRYRGTTARTYEVVAELVRTGFPFAEMIDKMDNSIRPQSLAYEALGLSNIETFLGGKLAIAAVSHDALVREGIVEEDMGSVKLVDLLRRVVGWDIDVGLVETAPKEIKVGLRTRDANAYDVSRLAVALGGGGHRAAAGAGITGKSLDEAKKLVVAKAKELYML